MSDTPFNSTSGPKVVVEGNFPQQHEHCWHYLATPASAEQRPMHCCYCNEPYVFVMPLAASAQQHGPYA